MLRSAALDACSSSARFSAGSRLARIARKRQPRRAQERIRGDHVVQMLDEDADFVIGEVERHGRDFVTAGCRDKEAAIPLPAARRLGLGRRPAGLRVPPRALGR
jgi:hypothetical protein